MPRTREENILHHYLFGDKIIQNCLKINDYFIMGGIYYWDKKLKKDCMSWKMI